MNYQTFKDTNYMYTEYYKAQIYTNKQNHLILSQK